MAVRVEKDNEFARSAMGTDMMLCHACRCYFSACRVQELLRCSTYHKLIVGVFDDTRGAYNE
jgi:hypothetical protein